SAWTLSSFNQTLIANYCCQSAGSFRAPALISRTCCEGNTFRGTAAGRVDAGHGHARTRRTSNPVAPARGPSCPSSRPNSVSFSTRGELREARKRSRRAAGERDAAPVGRGADRYPGQPGSGVAAVDLAVQLAPAVPHSAVHHLARHHL